MPHAGTSFHGRNRLLESCTNRPEAYRTPILGGLVFLGSLLFEEAAPGAEGLEPGGDTSKRHEDRAVFHGKLDAGGLGRFLQGGA